MICQHCNNSFKSIKSLQQHQRKTKYCLLQQNKDFRCNGCNKISFSTNDNDTHMSNCIIILKNTISELKEENKDIIYFQEQMNKYKELNEEKEKNYKEQLIDKDNQIKFLQEQIFSITKTAISKPTTTNNNNTKILNMSIINFENSNVENIINDKFNLDMISEGQKGVAKFAANYLLKDTDNNLNYVCTDPSRKIFKYKNDTGDIEKDINAQKLTNILTDNGLIKKTIKISTDYWTDEDGTIDNDKFINLFSKTAEIRMIQEDNTIFKHELINQTTV